MLEFNDTKSYASNANVVIPFNIVAPIPFMIKLALPSVSFKASTDVSIILDASILTAAEAALPT